MLSLAFALHGGGLQPRWSEFNCGVSGGPEGPRDTGGPEVLRGP